VVSGWWLVVGGWWLVVGDRLRSLSPRVVAIPEPEEHRQCAERHRELNEVWSDHHAEIPAEMALAASDSKRRDA
jgi:hypothetical protein